MPRRLTPEQEAVGRDFARALEGARYIVQKAAYEGGLVEANLTNPAGGDRDSVGPLQERSHYGSVSRRRNPFLSAQRFRREAEALIRAGFHGDSGDLAAAVQKPAAEFESRYGKRGSEAAALVKAFGLRGGGGGGSGGGSSAAPGMVPAASAPGSVPQGSEGALPLLQAILGQQAPAVPSGQLAAPAASARPALPAGAQLPTSGGGPSPQPDIGALLAAAQTVGGDTPVADRGGAVDPGIDVSPAAHGREGQVTLDPNADRKGVHTHQAVLDFAAQVSAIAGLPVRIGTGTNHSQMTVNGNVSEHWTGNAGDIPASGKRLIALGRAALVAAGMSEREARKQTGGLYNVNGYQVIFNTQEGGDHTGHLHIGVGRAKR